MYEKQIKELQSKLKRLKAKEAAYKKKNSKLKNKNNYIKHIAKDFKKELLSRMTSAEIAFQQTALKLGIHLEPQHIIYIMQKGVITRFFIADFCDIHNKIIFEVDGKYHSVPSQIIADTERTDILQREGYTIYRITNKDVYKNLAKNLLIKVYGLK